MSISIGELIKTERKKKGLTQKQLGELCGMADSAIRRYESHRVTPTFQNLYKIFVALDIKEYNMLAICRRYSEIDQGRELLITDDLLEISEENLLKYYNSLNLDGKKEAIKIIRILQFVPEYTEKDDLPFD